MESTRRVSTPLLIGGLFVVAASLAVLFIVPHAYFIAATYAATTCMIVVTYLLTRYRGLFRPGVATIAFGLVTAVALYLIFYLGNLGVNALHPLGMSTSNENSIYSLIASPSNPLYSQVAVLGFDAVGYESFFRGALQTHLEPRMGIGSVFLVALIDALLHVITLNPLWVVTTFIADSVWGLTYYYSKDLTSSVASHFVWDLVIFILLPIR
ncbi:MAG: CPBP family intramembrane metalloprotease [Thaumarchaeota archaeon]|nr:CPBP family intramembrane metalloprotease [Nitrososphaerota archaeon]